jgi:hypothetical protein
MGCNLEWKIGRKIEIVLAIENVFVVNNHSFGA